MKAGRWDYRVPPPEHNNWLHVHASPLTGYTIFCDTHKFLMKVLLLVLVECMDGTDIDTQGCCLSAITDGCFIISDGVVGTSCLDVVIDRSFHSVLTQTSLRPIDGCSGCLALQ